MKNKQKIIDLTLVIIGNIILSVGIAFFIIPNDILSGGLAGVAVSLEPLINVSPEITINVLTVLFFVFGFLVLGKDFAAKTLMSALIYPAFLTFFATFNYTPTTNPLLAAIYGGVLIGLGVGLVFRSGASTGGMDIPPLIVHKYTKLPLSQLVFITDTITVLFGAMVYGLEAALIGLISVWACSQMINKMVTLGTHESKSVLIISKHYEEIKQIIYEKLDRGVTLLDATGGYSNAKSPMIMVVINKKQYHDLNKYVSIIDPDAFMIISDVNEVRGLGFTYGLKEDRL